ncbi:unannotated protein [freshwater metagenome]|uniref:Unannotated protein n=1 Tax=freshwater metagenome TaxID=449393 RepID=A0A6J7K6T4_9ZZZZ
MAPIAMVSTPATSAVAAVTMAIALTMSVPPPTNWPFMSLAVPMMSGFRMTM